MTIFCRYYSQLEEITKPGSHEERLQIYEAVSAVFPKADLPKLIPLTFTSGNASSLLQYEQGVFEQSFQSFIRYLHKRCVSHVYRAAPSQSLNIYCRYG